MENTLTLTMYEREVYGVARLYPKNEQAKRLARLIGTKTFSATALKDLRAIGFHIRIEIRPEEV